jgi:hypothetical protein
MKSLFVNRPLPRPRPFPVLDPAAVEEVAGAAATDEATEELDAVEPEPLTVNLVQSSWAPR